MILSLRLLFKMYLLFSNSSFRNWIAEPQINWKPKLGKGVFDVLVGTTFLDQRNEGLAQSASGFSSEGLMKNLAAGTTRTTATNYYSQYRYNAIFGRINYNLNRKYIINITGRRDGSSRFGPGKQFANFGAAGLGWIFSKENFIQKALPFLSFGKLRASYGTSGNDQIGDYQYLDAYTSSGIYQGGVGLTPVRLSNPDFAWEINKKLEAAIDLGFMQDRILLAVSWYRNRSSNQLVGFPLAPTTGFASIQGNFPATIQNTGVEVELEAAIIQRKDLSWTASFNLSIPRNKLIAFPDIETFPVYVNQYVVG
ncbi:MAG: TonB-dependent receptor [Bacteroidota bacterium]